MDGRIDGMAPVPPNARSSQLTEEAHPYSGLTGIGIDLGTTHSVVGIMHDGEPTAVAAHTGRELVPSVVSFCDDGTVLVGNTATHRLVMAPQDTIYSVTRSMGRRLNEVARTAQRVPYTFTGDLQEPVLFEIQSRHITPERVSAQLLKTLTATAESTLGQKVDFAVITVPTYFTLNQRQAIKDAAMLAGLEVARVISNSGAVALTFEKKQEQKIIILDLGGGTFDVAVVDCDMESAVMLTVNGDTQLGGDDFDGVLINHIADDFHKDSNIDLRADAIAFARLREAAENAKRQLSVADSAEIHLPAIMEDAVGVKHLQMSVSRTEFEALIDPLVERCREPIMNALNDAHLNPGEIDEIVLVGGSMRIPKIQQFVEDLLGKRPYVGFLSRDDIVAVGAAIQAGILSGDVTDAILLDAIPLSLGIETEGGIMTRLIERNSLFPTNRSRTFTTVADNQTAVTIQILEGERQMAADNLLVGEFNLEGIPRAPRGTPQIEVTFDVDVNRVLNVQATDNATGNRWSVCIEDLTRQQHSVADISPITLFDDEDDDVLDEN